MSTLCEVVVHAAAAVVHGHPAVINRTPVPLWADSGQMSTGRTLGLEFEGSGRSRRRLKHAGRQSGGLIRALRSVGVHLAGYAADNRQLNGARHTAEDG